MADNYRVVKIPTAKLSSGHEIPVVGLGTWKSGKGEVQAAVEVALRAGYRHIDCAHVYGNEDEVGSAFDNVFGEGVVRRSEVFVTSKLWNSSHAATQVKEACLQTLKAMKLNYLDLYLMHWPYTGNKGPTVEPPVQETWAAMEQLVDEGLVRSIGVSNFSAVKLRKLMENARIAPSVLQVELHPYLRQDALLDFCRSANIHVTAYSPLGSPDSADLPMLKRASTIPALMKQPLVGEIAKKVGKDVGQVLIRWAIQRGTSVIPKSSNPKRIESNLEVLDWELPAEEFQALSSFPEQIRYITGTMWLNPEGPYRTLGELWDDPEEDVRYKEMVKKYVKED